MADAMVTARMSQEKKEQGNAILGQLGTSASGAINRLYDYLLEHKSLPFGDDSTSRQHSPEEIAAAWEFVHSIPLEKGNRFTSMSDDEIRMERLAAKGHFDWLGK